MAGPGNILIKIGAEAGQAITELGRVNAAMGKSATTSEKIGAGLKRAAVPATIALTAIAVGAKKAINAAAGLEKAMQKNEAVFGKNAAAVEDWSKSLAASFGLSESEALTAAGRLGNLLENLGYGKAQAAGMSEQFVQLAADLASFNNVPVDETLKAIQAGLGGATRGLKKYGVVISATAVKSEALKLGLYDGTGAIDKHAKAAATASLILKQTSKAQGDFAKNSEDAANASKVNAAQMENLKEELGRGLLPYYEAGQRLLISFTKLLGENTRVIQVVVGAVAALSAAILLANIGLKAYTIATDIAKIATIAFSAANRAMMVSLATNPVTLIIVAIVALGVALVYAYKKSATFRAIVHGALSVVSGQARLLANAFVIVKNAAVAAFDWIVAHWRLAAFALGPLGAGIVLLVDHFDAVKRAGAAAFDALLAPIRLVARAIEAVIASVKDLIGWLGKIHVPSVKLPHIPGLNLAVAYPPAPASALAGGYGAAVQPRATIAGGAGSGVVVNFYGPTDPEGAARAIAKVMRSHEIRQGRARGVLQGG